MSMAIIKINGAEVVADSASIKRSASDLISTASISLPYNHQNAVIDVADVAIEYGGRVIFHGVQSGDWSLNYNGADCSMTIPCCDMSYKLSHMVSVSPNAVHAGIAQCGSETTVTLASNASATDDIYNGIWIEIISGTGVGQTNKITDYDGTSKIATVETAWTTQPDVTSVYEMYKGYKSGTDIGSVIYDLLDGTGINRSHINQFTGITLDAELGIKTGEMRLSTIKGIESTYGCLFYLTYNKVSGVVVTYGEFDLYENISTSDEFSEVHTISDVNIITFSVSIKSVPEMVCNRVIATRTTPSGTEVGVSTYGAAPYLDKVVAIDPTNTTDINTLASSYLTNYRSGMSQLDISFRDLSVGLYNLIDISGLSRIKTNITQYRATDLTYSVSDKGVISTVSSVDPDIELWDASARSAATQQSIDRVIEKEADAAVQESLPRVATIVDINTSTLVVKYTPEESETLQDWTAI